LTSLADLAEDKLVQSHISKAFRKSKDPTRLRALVADIVEATILLSRKLNSKPRQYNTCSRVLADCLELLPTTELIKSVELLLTNPDYQVQVAAVKSVDARAGSVVQNDQQSVFALLSLIPRLDELLQKAQNFEVTIVAVSCVDRIIERFGKKDIAAVVAIAQTMSTASALKSSDDRIRILSLLCLTSIIDVLEEEAISLLPTVLPTAFDYLKESIQHEKQGLHNAVFALLSDITERLSFMFSREYIIPSLELAQRSAEGDLDESCDESRQHFHRSVAKNLGAKEVFTALRSTWPTAINQGFEVSRATYATCTRSNKPQACREQLDLVLSTIENQSKSQTLSISSTLFSLLIEVFDIRHAIASREDKDVGFDNDEIEQLESIFIDSVIAMTLKLNDTTFRPFFVQITDLARSITFCKFLAAFFDRFKSIVTGYASYTIEHFTRLLSYLADKDTASQAYLRRVLLTALQKSFQHDQDGFWQAPSHYGSIMKPLLQQLTIDSSSEVSDIVIPAITELAAASSSSLENHREMNGVLLKYMRAETANTRLATVYCEQSLTKRLGEEWLALLPEMLPFVAELREDDDEMVERETQRWIGMMEEILGEDLESMLQ
jgi:U3 small nucleolar RNA-associated protein 10